MNEASGLNFDHLWILNFNDQVWPPAINPSPFLPYALQKESGLPGSHSDVQHSLAQDSCDILFRSVSGTLNSSHHRSDSEQEYRASSFSRAFAQQLQGDVQAQKEEIFPLYGTRYGSQCKLTLAPDDEAVPLQPSSDSLGGHSVLSDQSSCPFHAFLLHRLHASPLEPFATGLSRAARGTAIHEALEHLFGQIIDRQSLVSMSDNQRTELCDTAADQAIVFLRRVHQSLMTPRFERIERQRLSRLLEGFLGKERERGEFTVLAREERRSWQYRGMVFNLKIDRIDRLEDGSLAVIDYKTGKTAVSPTTWLSERPQDLQLPFYSTVMNAAQTAPVSAIAIAHVNAERTDYSGIMAQREFHKSLISVSEKLPGDMDWPGLNRHFQQKIETIADEFLAGIATITPADYSDSCGNY
ncbi:MAG: PD-(D/E)XK nuclease family protein, partial [Pirellulales bacterium]|nr:PD-(D/E)XK nuclease family protein [Pirellulales bacterium]